MIENLQDKLYQLENKQTEDAKLGATHLWLIVGGRRAADWTTDFWGKGPQVHLIIIKGWPKNTSPPTIRHKEVILDRRWREENAPKLSLKYVIHEIRAKLVSNWEQNMLYNKS